MPVVQVKVQGKRGLRMAAEFRAPSIDVSCDSCQVSTAKNKDNQLSPVWSCE